MGVASLPFAPEIVLPTVQYFQDVYPQVTGEYCLRCSFNLTFPHEGCRLRLDLAVPFWDQPRSGRVDVRKLPVGVALAADARVPLRRDGTAAGGFHEGLAMTVMEDGAVTGG